MVEYCIALTQEIKGGGGLKVCRGSKPRAVHKQGEVQRNVYTPHLRVTILLGTLYVTSPPKRDHQHLTRQTMHGRCT
jgi:hypothetical protein